MSCGGNAFFCLTNDGRRGKAPASVGACRDGFGTAWPGSARASVAFRHLGLSIMTGFADAGWPARRESGSGGGRFGQRGWCWRRGWFGRRPAAQHVVALAQIGMRNKQEILHIHRILRPAGAGDRERTRSCRRMTGATDIRMEAGCETDPGRVRKKRAARITRAAATEDCGR